MTEILTPDRFATSPWKNGGGVTHEIARAEAGGRWLWRLSIAEVAADGPFSRFEGMARILTVIDGAGLDLETPHRVIAALPHRPVAFAGDLPILARLRGGSVRDLNLIYDPERVRGSVRLLTGPTGWGVEGPAALLGLSGGIQADGQPVPAGACALGPDMRLNLARGAMGLLIGLTESPSTRP